MASKPNVLVFGSLDIGVTVFAQQLIPPLPAEPLVSHLRIVDRFGINPPTTFLSKSFLKALEERKDILEYRQANLTNPAAVSKAFTDPAPNGQPYTHIFDSTGELQPDRPVAVYVANTFNVALSIARSSAAQLSQNPGSIKAHIRVMPPFYEHTDDSVRYKEVDAGGWRPKDQRCAWWHEMLRAVGSVDGLPLVVVRPGLLYGEGFLGFEIVASILLGLVYKHLGKDINLIWSPNLPKNTLNVHDWVNLAWKTAEWVSTKTREEAISIAGASLPPSNDESVTTNNAPDIIPASAGNVVVPVFNIVDDSDSTQASLSEVVGRVFNVKSRFKGPPQAGMTLEEVSQEVNQLHMEAWNDLITNSTPPVPFTPLSPYLPVHFIKAHGCAMNGDKIKAVLDYRCKYPHFDHRAVKDYINWCRSEGIWPETTLYTDS